jgi:hypothetical protein
LGRLRELRQHLLPGQLDPTRSYSVRQIDRVLAYRVLTHAELEHCMEQLVAETVTAAWKGYAADHKPRTCLLALLAYYEGQLGGPPETLSPGQNRRKFHLHLQDRINQARDHHLGTVVRNNHGISETNVLRLLMPVGIGAADLDQTWLNDATAYSAARNQVAHQTGRVQQIPDPAGELDRVRKLALGLEPIDARLGELRSR